jgi:hypothetical protein
MSGGIKNSHIGVLGFTGCLIFALDINHLLEDTQSLPMISARVSGHWIDDVHRKLSRWETFGFAQPRFAESAYAKTDRAARNTFTARHAEQLLPLEIAVVDPPHAVHRQFAYSVEGIRISPQGALSVRVVVNAEGGVVLSAKDVVHNYHSLVSVVPEMLHRTVEQFVAFWNSSIDYIKLVVPSRRDLMSQFYSYDIWDYDFVLIEDDFSHPVTSVKCLYSQPESTPLQELTAIANMDIADVESLQDVRLTQFTDSDIGTRDDELWAIGRERMTRRHPERAVTYNIAFFTDIKLATEMLVGYECTVDFMEEWVRRQRRSLLDEILRYSDLSELRRQDLQQRYDDVIRASQILVEPLAIERGVKHTFFAQVIVRLAEMFELNMNMARSARAMSEFAELVSTISGFHDAELNTKLSNMQVELAKTSRRIGLLGIALAILAILIAAAQVYVALKPPK